MSDDNEVYDSIMRGLDEALRYAKGEDVPGLVVHHPKPSIDVAAIRGETGLSQDSFAKSIGVSPKTLRNWEQGRRMPQGPARVLLALVAKRPSVVRELLAG